MNLVNNLMQKTNELTASINKLRDNGISFAQAEHDYKITLAQETLKLRDGGMAVGLINLTVYGNREVAKKRLERDIAETIYKTNQEHINSVKLQMRIIESQLQREWGNVK